MDLKDAVSEYATLLIDVADFARYNLDCDTARDAAVSDQLHGGEEKRPTQAAKDRARASEPPMPHGDMNIELALLCAVGGEHDPFKENWRRLPKRMRDDFKEEHEEFVAACASGDWREVETCAECLTTDLLEAANAAERKSRDGYTEADRKRDEKSHEAALYSARELKRKSDNARKTGRANQRKGEKNGNGRKTDPRLKNQIMTEVRQTMRGNPHFLQSDACRIVSLKHLKADGKTPIFSKRTIENWMSEANGKSKAKQKP